MFLYYVFCSRPVVVNEPGAFVPVSSTNIHPESRGVSTGTARKCLIKEAKGIPITLRNKSEFFILLFSPLKSCPIISINSRVVFLVILTEHLTVNISVCNITAVNFTQVCSGLKFILIPTF